jgi:predicted DNA-binding protein (UPF0251 family)
MPRKSDIIAINNEKLDRRVKLTAEDKELVIWLREEEQITYQKIADRFGVSKRLIIFVCKPETKARELEKRALRGGSKLYYNKEYNRVAMKQHRDYKKKLFSEGLIK